MSWFCSNECLSEVLATLALYLMLDLVALPLLAELFAIDSHLSLLTGLALACPVFLSTSFRGSLA